jgi:hypothetical protein
MDYVSFKICVVFVCGVGGHRKLIKQVSPKVNASNLHLRSTWFIFLLTYEFPLLKSFLFLFKSMQTKFGAVIWNGPPSLSLRPSFYLLYSPHGPWPLIFIFMIILQMVGLLGRVISSSQGLYLNAGQHIHIPNTHALCWIRIHDLGFQAIEDSTCLRPLSYFTVCLSLILHIIRR